MQDHSIPEGAPGAIATVASGVVASWTSWPGKTNRTNQEFTIHVTFPKGGADYAVIDMFM